ncbi:BrnT family toxin [Candidimonas nitroreducens]|uniref:BrnT family toxin n=1 Tax=Candidimonas nitroreducens TaxID=683354 RepID=UPI001E385E3B|nr:BrnT family toxin [Candidimonas nitroreducens]
MNYHEFVEFEWDKAKSDACFAERGFDFTYVLRVFADPGRLVVKDVRWDYGEDRYQVLGRVETRVFVVVYTLRGSGIRIISARKANQRELKFYENGASKN